MKSAVAGTKCGIVLRGHEVICARPGMDRFSLYPTLALQAKLQSLIMAVMIKYPVPLLICHAEFALTHTSHQCYQVTCKSWEHASSIPVSDMHVSDIHNRCRSSIRQNLYQYNSDSQNFFTSKFDRNVIWSFADSTSIPCMHHYTSKQNHHHCMVPIPALLNNSVSRGCTVCGFHQGIQGEVESSAVVLLHGGFQIKKLSG